MIIEEGSSMEVIQTQNETGDYHQDPPNRETMKNQGVLENPMSNVVFDESQPMSRLGAMAQ